MRRLLAPFLFVGLSPMSPRQSPTALTHPVEIAAALPAVPPIPPAPDRDAPWMTLAPKAPPDPTLARTTVDFPAREPGGTIVVDPAEPRLCLVQSGGKAMR